METVKPIERVAQLIENEGLSYNSFDKKIEMSNGYIGKLIKNKSNIGADVLQKIFYVFRQKGYSGEWLLGLDVPMKIIDNSNFQLNEPPTNVYSEDPFEECLLKMLKKERIKQAVVSVVAQEYPQIRPTEKTK